MSRHSLSNNKYLKIFYTTLGLIMIIVMAISLYKKIEMNYKINKEMETLKQDISNLETNKKSLSSLIEYLKTEDFIEKEGRLKLGLQKNGETMTVIQNLDQLLVSTSSIDNTNKTSKTNIDKWIDYLLSEN